MTDTQPQTEIALSVQASMVPGPDGQPMVALLLSFGFSAHQILMTAEAAEAVGDVITGALREAASTVRRSRLGLVVPGPGSIDLSKLNGNGSG